MQFVRDPEPLPLPHRGQHGLHKEQKRPHQSSTSSVQVKLVTKNNHKEYYLKKVFEYDTGERNHDAESSFHVFLWYQLNVPK